MNHTVKLALRRVTQAGAGLSALTLALAGGTGAAFAAQAPQLAHGSASILGNDLSIHGTAGTDDIAITLADPTHLAVDFHNGVQPQTFDLAAFGLITVNLGDGNDQFLEQPSGGVLASKPLVVFGGNGNDSIIGGDANDTLYGGAGDDVIAGGDGVDLIFGGIGNDIVNGNKGNDTEILGDGDDTAVWNPGEASDTVDGGTGIDTLAFNGSALAENMNLFADHSHAIFTRDLGTIRMDLAHLERVDVATLAGSDRVEVDNLAGTGVTQANIDLSAGGKSDNEFDDVNVAGTNRSDDIAVGASAGVVSVRGLSATVNVTGADTTDELQINTLLGKDRATVSNKASQSMDVNVQFGPVAL